MTIKKGIYLEIAEFNMFLRQIKSEIRHELWLSKYKERKAWLEIDPRYK